MTNTDRPSLVTLATGVLRDPSSLLDAAADRVLFAHLAPRLLGIAVIGTAVFGAVVGSYRGGIQLVFAAVKMPALLLVPMVVGLPAVAAFFRACDLQATWPRLTMAALIGVARAGVLSAAAAPVLWLLYSLHVDYHVAVMVLAGSVGVLGLPGLITVARAVPGFGWRHVLATGCSVLLLGALVAQTGWLLRPFVARPTVDVAFLRPVEEDIVSSLSATAHSAVGDYPEWETAPAGALGHLQDSRADEVRR